MFEFRIPKPVRAAPHHLASVVNVYLQPWQAVVLYFRVRRDLLGTVTAVVRERGDLVDLRLGRLRILLVSAPAMIHNVLVTQNRAFHKAKGPIFIGDVLGDGLLTSEDTAWRRSRRMIQPAFARKTVAQAMGVDVGRIAVDVLGLNHLSFARVWLDGRDVTPAVLGLDPNLDPALRARPDLPANQFGAALMSQVGRLPSSYLRYYWQPEQALAEQRQEVAAGQGTRADQIRALEPDIFAAYGDATTTELPAGLAQRGGAYYSTVAVELVAALAQNQAVESVVNVPNQTVLSELPPDAVIEVSALVDGRGARPLAVGPLPPAVAGLVQQVKAYERLSIEAALTGSRSAALAALLNNPLVPSQAVAEALLEDLLQAHATNLPRFHR